MNVANDVLYYCAKFQDEIHYIRGYTRIINSNKCWRFQNLYCSRFQIYGCVNFAQPKILSLSYYLFSQS
jgi:hypothetical protein